MNRAIGSFNNNMPVLGTRVYIHDSAVVIGNVIIGDDSSVWPTAVIRGDMNTIRVGTRTSIQDGAVLHITHASDYNPGGYALTIGNDVTVGHRAVLHGCTIGNRCLIGIGATILDGSVLDEEIIIAAGSLVPPGKRLESGFLYKGSPATKARALSDKERRFFTYTAQNYVKLKDQYLLEVGQDLPHLAGKGKEL